MNIELKSVIQDLSDYIETHDYAGWDPYDALNSPLTPVLTFGTKPGRILWTQLLRRSPINFRRLLQIKPGINPKGLGLILWSYAKLFSKTHEEIYKNKVVLISERLVELRSPGYSGSCWGYHFPWQSRAAYLKSYTPTIVNTSFIGHALLDAAGILNSDHFMNLAADTSKFILNDLNRKNEKTSFCFSYTPVDNNFVHNANLLGASLLIRLYSILKNQQLLDAALASLQYSMKYQHEDGSWFYAETGMQRWIDSFHTGFNLQAIRWFITTGYGQEYLKNFDKGSDYYARMFFLDDGTPKYYHNELYPIDIHAPAQAIVFFSNESIQYADLCDKILLWMLNNMRDCRGFFYYRKNRFIRNKIPYMRWSQAWVFHALTEYFLCRSTSNPAGKSHE